MPGTAGPFQGNRLYKRDGTSAASRLPAANCVKAEALASRNGVRVVLLGKASFGVMVRLAREVDRAVQEGRDRQVIPSWSIDRKMVGLGRSGDVRVDDG